MNRRNFVKWAGVSISGIVIALTGMKLPEGKEKKGLTVVRPVKNVKAKPKEEKKLEGLDNHIPVGYIISFPIWKEAPEGWHECDGSELSKIKYASLFAAMGTTYGASVNTFRLPYLRGRFLGDGYGNDIPVHEHLNTRYIMKVKNV